jgi:hypothetical protein
VLAGLAKMPIRFRENSSNWAMASKGITWQNSFTTAPKRSRVRLNPDGVGQPDQGLITRLYGLLRRNCKYRARHASQCKFLYLTVGCLICSKDSTQSGGQICVEVS